MVVPPGGPRGSSWCGQAVARAPGRLALPSDERPARRSTRRDRISSRRPRPVASGGFRWLGVAFARPTEMVVPV